MNCTYCDKIKATDPQYKSRTAEFDLTSAAPRCSWHWRFHCAHCGEPAHFMALAYCPERGAFFCAGCATETREIPDPFWAWKYYFAYRSPWTGKWQPALDRLEFEGRHPLQRAHTTARALASLDRETQFVRYPIHRVQWPADQDAADDEVRFNWNRNAERWDSLYNEDGDQNRRYMSDEPMLAMLGEVCALDLLDVGSGNGYLSRKLAKRGARVTGVELADRFLEMAREHERARPLGVSYYHGSISAMDFLPENTFDKAVSNYVLMDVPDYKGALSEVWRVLRPGGIFVVVISHPCFSSGSGGWYIPAPDTPRREDWYALQVDGYFHRGPILVQWGIFDPVLSFHRPLRDYWQAFTETGFSVEGFEEPSITARGRRELPPSRVEYSQRLTYSCIFKLRKTG